MHWDNGVNDGNSIGTGGEVEFDVAARWEPAQLAEYDDGAVYEIAFFPAESAATYRARVYAGAGPDTMLFDQQVSSPLIGQWNYVVVDPPLPLDITRDLWVGYHVDTPTGYPAAVDDGPAIDGYGNMMYYDSAWQTLLQINPELDYNWNIAWRVGQAPVEPKWYYKIYRQIVNEDFILIDSTFDWEYRDSTIVLEDIYCYKVSAVWTEYGDTCESALSNPVCETAMLGTQLPEKPVLIRVYPNPAISWLMIESQEEIGRVKLYNLLGELILAKNVYRQAYSLDVHAIPGGIYFLKVESGEKDYTKKIVILR